MRVFCELKHSSGYGLRICFSRTRLERVKSLNWIFFFFANDKKRDPSIKCKAMRQKSINKKKMHTSRERERKCLFLILFFFFFDK